MKIFNWINRKFGSKDGRSVKKDEFVAKETDKNPLIDNLGFVDAIDVSWRDDLLTIGTLGFDHLQILIPEEEYFGHLFPGQNGEESENDDDEYLEEQLFEGNNEVDEENLNTLLLVEMKMKNDLLKGGLINSIGGNIVEPQTRNEKIVDCGFNNEEKDLRDDKKKKVTLAELFSAESNEEGKDHNEKENKKTKLSNKCTSGHSKHNLSFVKKLIPGVARAHKLNQMVTRVLNRKIHPDPASQGKQQKERHIKRHQLSCVKHSINETVSLLQTKGVAI